MVILLSQVCKHNNSANCEKSVKLCTTNKQHVTMTHDRSALGAVQETKIYNGRFLLWWPVVKKFFSEHDHAIYRWTTYFILIELY